MYQVIIIGNKLAMYNCILDNRRVYYKGIQVQSVGPESQSSHPILEGRLYF